MATKTLRVFAEYTSTGFVPMPTAGNIDYGYTLGSTFPATTPTSFQTDNPDLVVTVSAMTDFYVWIRINGQAWNPSYTRNVRVYPDSPNINNVVMNMIIATGPAGVAVYTQIVQTSNRLYFNGATTDATYNSKFAGKTYINELNFGTAPGLATVATSGAYADLTGKPTLATVATSGLFTDLSSKPSGTSPLSYNSGTNSFVITQANTSTNGYLSSTDWNTFNNKLATPSGTTLQYVDGTGALQTFPLLASADKLVINVRNASGVSMPKGSVVYINGATGNKPTIALSQGNSDATSAQTLGLLQATLANNAEGNVVIVGSVIDLNTSAFSEGQQLYLSPTTAGTYTATKQYAPNHLVYVGIVTRSHVSLGTIEVKVQNGYEMDELHNVSAQSPSNNDGLFYNTTTSLWEKKSIATVLGYTPYNGTDTSIKALFSATTPLSYSNGVYGISQATTSSNGYLSSTDWNTFNGKESVLSFTTPLVRTTNTISINQASASTSGFLSSTDWNTFNNKSTTSGTVTSVAMTMPLGLSVSGSPITSSGTFGVTLTAGYVIPTTTSTSQWDSAYTNRITSLTVTGSSGASTLVSNVLNVPTYTLSGLGGQPALNGTGFVKISGTTISYDNSTYLTTASAASTYQTIITNNITGTGTINELAYFNSASSIASLAVATYPSLTELSYVKGVTSAIQTQINTKQATISLTTTGTSGNATFSSNTLNIPNYGSALSGYLPLTGGTLTGALSGTSATFSGSITSTITNALVLSNNTSTTQYVYMSLANSVGNARYGVDNSSGGGLGTGTSANSAVFGNAGNADVDITTNNISRFKIASTGAATFSNSVTANSTFTLIGGNATNNTENAITQLYDANSNLMGKIVGYRGANGNEGNLRIYTNNTTPTLAMSITNTGNVGIGTTSPDKLLTLYSSVGSLDTGAVLRLIGNTAQDLVDISVADTKTRIYHQENSGDATAGYGIIQLRTNASANTSFPTRGGFQFTVGSTDAMFVSNIGTVGIGITPDSSKLSVQASLNEWSSIMYGNTTSSQSYGLLIRGGTNSNDIAFKVQNATATSTYFNVRGDGNVGIGTSSPSQLLHTYVATGSIRTLTETGNTSSSAFTAKNSTQATDYGTDSIGGFIQTQGAYPLLIYTNSTERMRITSGGNILMGTATDNGERLYVSGAIRATGNITANSDLTLKKNLEIITNPIDKLMQLNGYAYQWKANDEYQYGVIAQEVEKVLPYAVQTGNDKIKGVAYNQLTPLLIEGFKSHESEITILKARVKYLESKLA